MENVTPAIGSNTSHEIGIKQINTNQHLFFLTFRGSLFALLVWTTGVGKSGDQSLKSTIHKKANSASELID